MGKVLHLPAWLVEHDGLFYNFYNAANAESSRWASPLQPTSWTGPGTPATRSCATARRYDEQFCSDGKVFRDGDHWVMFYFA